MRSVAKVIVLPLVVYASWLAMMAVHEAGHVVHAVASGGVVRAVHVPLLGFSLTEYDVNPHPHFVAWGGVVWGSLLPLAPWFLFHLVRLRGRTALQFFAGFCLVANGAYLAVGWAAQSGDGHDLLHYGTQRRVMVVSGTVMLAAGLLLWHRLGPVIRRK